MHVHLLQHAPAHAPARLTDWLTSMGHSHTTFHLYANELPPRPGDCDALILLGGPESLLDTPPVWQRAEDKLIRRLLDSDKPVLGIGLGAHVIARALGAVSAPGTFPETGWHQVRLSPQSPFALPERFDAFMWHRRVFSLPDEAQPLGASAAAPIQGFGWDAGRVVGLLFHLEVSRQSAEQLMHASQTPPGRGDYCQPVEQILADSDRFGRLPALLDRLLNQWLASGR